jgi:hypothetical protein
MASNYVDTSIFFKYELYGSLKQKVSANNSCALETTEKKSKCHYENNRRQTRTTTLLNNGLQLIRLECRCLGVIH